jgi:predicted transcriptional regulator
MMMCVRTTLILPDDLYRDVKRAAADGDRTVTSFVEEALRAALTRHNASTTAARTPYRVAPAGSGGLQPGVDLTDTAPLLDTMEIR